MSEQQLLRNAFELDMQFSPTALSGYESSWSERLSGVVDTTVAMCYLARCQCCQITRPALSCAICSITTTLGLCHISCHIRHQFAVPVPDFHVAIRFPSLVTHKAEVRTPFCAMEPFGSQLKSAEPVSANCLNT
jgi:hypothetical protein